MIFLAKHYDYFYGHGVYTQHVNYQNMLTGELSALLMPTSVSLIDKRDSICIV